ncbi:MAG: hypothetical protein L0241_18455 [Planctomycetia bacterium]|nr:hypothetical protein [Planctomycetia bacterium]
MAKRKTKAKPIGLILCEDKGAEQVELLQLAQSGIRVTSYFTELPPKDVFERKLKFAANLARKQLEVKTDPSDITASRRGP